MNRQSPHNCHSNADEGVRMVESFGSGGSRRRECGSVVPQEWHPTVLEGGGVGNGGQQGVAGRAGSEGWRKRCRSRRSAPCRHVPHREKAPTAVARRNARERRRVEAVNGAFLRLRRAVPSDGIFSGGNAERGKRVSKVKTLHRAIEYIAHLQEVLRDAGCQFTMGTYEPRGESQQHTVERGGIPEGIGADVIRWRGGYGNGYRESQMDYSFGVMQSYRNEF